MQVCTRPMYLLWLSKSSVLEVPIALLPERCWGGTWTFTLQLTFPGTEGRLPVTGLPTLEGTGVLADGFTRVLA